MKLLRNELIEAIKKKEIEFTGSLELVGVNSIDVTLGDTLKTYVPCKIETVFQNNQEFRILKPKTDDNVILDMGSKNKVYEYSIPEEGIVLYPGVLYLGSTNEVAGSENYIPMYEGRSSTARLGLQSHISAGFGDIGFVSNWTLEIIVVHPLKIYKNVRIGQVYFEKVTQKELENMKKNKQLYNSKYSHQPKPQESKMYLDFEK